MIALPEFPVAPVQSTHRNVAPATDKPDMDFASALETLMEGEPVSVGEDAGNEAVNVVTEETALMSSVGPEQDGETIQVPTLSEEAFTPETTPPAAVAEGPLAEAERSSQEGLSSSVVAIPAAVISLYAHHEGIEPVLTNETGEAVQKASPDVTPGGLKGDGESGVTPALRETILDAGNRREGMGAPLPNAREAGTEEMGRERPGSRESLFGIRTSPRAGEPTSQSLSGGVSPAVGRDAIPAEATRGIEIRGEPAIRPALGDMGFAIRTEPARMRTETPVAPATLTTEGLPETMSGEGAEVLPSQSGTSFASASSIHSPVTPSSTSTQGQIQMSAGGAHESPIQTPAMRMIQMERLEATVAEARGTHVQMELPEIGEGALLHLRLRGQRVDARILLPEGPLLDATRADIPQIRASLEQGGIESGSIRADAIRDKLGMGLTRSEEGVTLNLSHATSEGRGDRQDSRSDDRNRSMDQRDQREKREHREYEAPQYENEMHERS